MDKNLNHQLREVQIDYDLTELERNALEYAKEIHKGVYRKGNLKEEYINHPIRVANLVRKYKSDSKGIEYLITASFLHDTIEDTKKDKNKIFNDIVEKFGIQVASLVKELTSIKEIKKEIGKDKYLAIELTNMSNWALDIKLCDRLDNISDLENVDIEFRERYVKETKYIIEYLTNNRELTKTHLNIIKEILSILNKYNIKDEIQEKPKIKEKNIYFC